MKLIIYGAKSMALGACHAIQTLYPEQEILCFLVKSLKDNPSELAGLPVRELETVATELTVEEKNGVTVLVGTPEILHEIKKDLENCGFERIACLDSKRMAVLMERYFTSEHIFPSLHCLPQGCEKIEPFVIMTKFYKDRVLKSQVSLPSWTHPLQVGTALTEERVAELLDSTGELISEKKCELL